jgi:hypothetical protein
MIETLTLNVAFSFTIASGTRRINVHMQVTVDAFMDAWG